ncbi:MAG: hypothetical protein ACO30M_09585, partial [Candidatus Kapaibacteriota bacterium]
MLKFYKISMPLVILASIMMTGCGGKKNSGSTADQSGPSYNTKLWKKYDTPPGADPSVKDIDGGGG